jgi:hypothetical protein
MFPFPLLSTSDITQTSPFAKMAFKLANVTFNVCSTHIMAVLASLLLKFLDI